MTKTAMLSMAIKIIKIHARDYYGWEAKFHPDKKDKYDQLMEICKFLEGLKDTK